MCAEADSAHCHRSYIADAAVARGVEVFHILLDGSLRAHNFSPFGQVADGVVTYPGLFT